MMPVMDTCGNVLVCSLGAVVETWFFWYWFVHLNDSFKKSESFTTESDLLFQMTVSVDTMAFWWYSHRILLVFPPETQWCRCWSRSSTSASHWFTSDHTDTAPVVCLWVNSAKYDGESESRPLRLRRVVKSDSCWRFCLCWNEADTCGTSLMNRHSSVSRVRWSWAVQCIAIFDDIQDEDCQRGPVFGLI